MHNSLNQIGENMANPGVIMPKHENPKMMHLQQRIMNITLDTRHIPL